MKKCSMGSLCGVLQGLGLHKHPHKKSVSRSVKAKKTVKKVVKKVTKTKKVIRKKK